MEILYFVQYIMEVPIAIRSDGFDWISDSFTHGALKLTVTFLPKDKHTPQTLF